MNKKFSTLVAGLLLASAVGVNAQAPVLGDELVKLTGTNEASISAVLPYDGVVGGYEVGKAYLLGANQNKVLLVDGTDGSFTLKYGAPVKTSVAELHKAMWRLENFVAS